MDPHGGGGGGAGLSRGSSAQKSRRIIFKHIINPRKISLLSSSATPPASATPLLPGKVDKSPTLETPRLDSSSSSATFIAHNEDLLTQILLFLPPKSLLRFQSISKKWLSIISNPTFRRLHCRKYLSSGLSFFLFCRLAGGSELDFISLGGEDFKSIGIITSRLTNLLDNGKVLRFHSCNGLLCIEIESKSDHREFIVYNPTTNHHRIIHLKKSAVEQDLFQSINIAFDPLKSVHYKLVSLWRNPDENSRELGIRVYSSESLVWRDIAETYEIYDVFFERGVYWSGGLHWVGLLNSICFDLDNECLRPMIPHPPSPSVFWNICYFGESGGHLYFIGLSKPQAMLVKVFSLKRDYSDWVVEHFIDLAPLTALYPSMVVEGRSSNDKKFDLRMPCFVVDEKEKKATVVISLEGKVISYDINDKIVKELAEVDTSHLQELSSSFRASSKYSWLDAIVHIETLACV